MSATKNYTLCSILVALGIVLGYVESLFPSFIYGLKIGFSNLVVIYAVYNLKKETAYFTGILKAILSGLLFSGVMSIAFSLFGILFSITLMLILRKKNEFFSEIGVSLAGSVIFQLGQCIVASIFMKSFTPIYYLPYLSLGAIPCGIISGLIVKLFHNRVSVKGEINE